MTREDDTELVIDEKTSSLKAKRKADALELASILYDIFKDNEDGAKIQDGQNNANQTKNE